MSTAAWSRREFPELIDPVQPMMDLRALTHEPAPGLRVTCRMEGDTFEMEDQRNWTDASYKTYVRPLALPWPYTLAAGETHRAGGDRQRSGRAGGGCCRRAGHGRRSTIGARGRRRARRSASGCDPEDAAADDRCRRQRCGRPGRDHVALPFRCAARP